MADCFYFCGDNLKPKLFLVQKTPSVDLQERYSANDKANSILRTLIAFHGKDNLWLHVSDYVYSEEAKELSFEDIYNLYQATKWANSFKE